MPKYFVRVVLTKTIEAANRDEASVLADYHAGDMDEHEVEVERVPDAEGETRA